MNGIETITSPAARTRRATTREWDIHRPLIEQLRREGKPYKVIAEILSQRMGLNITGAALKQKSHRWKAPKPGEHRARQDAATLQAASVDLNSEGNIDGPVTDGDTPFHPHNIGLGSTSTSLGHDLITNKQHDTLNSVDDNTSSSSTSSGLPSITVFSMNRTHHQPLNPDKLWFPAILTPFNIPPHFESEPPENFSKIGGFLLRPSKSAIVKMVESSPRLDQSYDANNLLSEVEEKIRQGKMPPLGETIRTVRAACSSDSELSISTGGSILGLARFIYHDDLPSMKKCVQDYCLFLCSTEKTDTLFNLESLVVNHLHPVSCEDANFQDVELNVHVVTSLYMRRAIPQSHFRRSVAGYGDQDKGYSEIDLVEAKLQAYRTRLGSAMYWLWSRADYVRPDTDDIFEEFFATSMSWVLDQLELASQPSRQDISVDGETWERVLRIVSRIIQVPWPVQVVSCLLRQKTINFDWGLFPEPWRVLTGLKLASAVCHYPNSHWWAIEYLQAVVAQGFGSHKIQSRVNAEMWYLTFCYTIRHIVYDLDGGEERSVFLLYRAWCTYPQQEHRSMLKRTPFDLTDLWASRRFGAKPLYSASHTVNSDEKQDSRGGVSLSAGFVWSKLVEVSQLLEKALDALEFWRRPTKEW